jgi:hypothetical protein
MAASEREEGSVDRQCIVFEDESSAESIEEELTVVESVMCQEGEFKRLSTSCVRLLLGEGTWLTVGN